jgi:energy-coupling factor transport system substrate-specific component
MKPNVKEIAIFGMLGALMYASKAIMELLPNIHLIGVFVIAATVVYRKKALYPIYIFIFLTGLLGGFATWWIPYLYIWAVLWGVVMLLPKDISPKHETIVYSLVCALHGFLYGTLYAPAQAILFGLDFRGMIDWIIVGLPYDLIHGVSNFFSGLLILPLITLLKRLNKEALKTI